MQIEALETFVKIAEAGNFFRASEVLCVTPSTVSARIQMLEDSLGQRLFRRSRTSVTLTQAGSVFLPYAQSVVRNWHKARREIALPKGFNGILTIAASPVIWGDLMASYLASFQRQEPTVAINAIVADPATTAAKLNAGEVDVAIFHEPALKAGWSATRLLTDELVLAATIRRELVRWDPKYVYIDWGRKFSDEVFRAYPVDDTPIVTFSDGGAALEYILRVGGSAYLPRRWINALPGRLHPVPRAPVFDVGIYAVFDAALLEAGDRRTFVDNFISAINRPEPIELGTISSSAARARAGFDQKAGTLT
ncbi:LysR family transcriptional regulator [Hyphomicrobium sp.]|uniref:LysR family transcriptional regulator n=1 Tax=Hyphomicrobium sp. TaxID=82 RepID=UPI001D2D03D4|nr:LysR family transcriptional regulator [Hyphomicrobium sp.]MBY0558906.1 LysR family transcriptional regulator [Hyphomicrobium sp.]